MVRARHDCLSVLALFVYVIVFGALGNRLPSFWVSLCCSYMRDALLQVLGLLVPTELRSAGSAPLSPSALPRPALLVVLFSALFWRDLLFCFFLCLFMCMGCS